MGPPEKATEVKGTWSAVSEAAAKVIRDQKAAYKAAAMALSEIIQSGNGLDAVRRAEPLIKKFAKNETQARLMRAIIFEEQVHQFPPFLEGKLEQSGFFPSLIDSVGLGQIRASLWAKRYDVNRAYLLTPEGAIGTMRRHLDYLETLALKRNWPVDKMAAMGSLWNQHTTINLKHYGLRVARFDKMLQSEEYRRRLSPRTKIEESLVDAKTRTEHRNKEANRGAPQRIGLPRGDSPRDFDKPKAARPGYDAIKAARPPAPASLTPAAKEFVPEKNVNEVPRDESLPIRLP